ncbi:succinyldiaminopimelate transaminase [Leucobacter sp. OH1287]|uniref:succinyldiaminopimelate transaminase n=1 Tax=Leucobacter sp. OH1287 TaxID=2491049 RepID=UPI000F5EAFF5|nr:succinyldiaminopimelate transaminase [Leucobacter sp. OH1287]RRD61809.1 succinyldiaminopimelate transaminase [Leucobacter sp. OH1287]
MVRQLPDYPWDTLAPYIAKAKAHPEGFADLSVGSPVDPAPDSAQRGLLSGAAAGSYPTTQGTEQLRRAICDWYLDSRGVTITPDCVIPTIGSKELVALLPFFLGLGSGDTIVIPEIAYPSYEMGAAFVGAEVVRADDPADWPESTRLIWINSPANPHGRVLNTAELKQRVARAKELGAVLASDECYAEFGWDEPWQTERIPSVLDPAVTDSHSGLLSVYSLSKQSNLAAYRAAFIAGDSELIAAILRIRKHAGLMLPYPVQTALESALPDTEHTREQRLRYQRRREILLPAVVNAGWEVSDSEAGLYLWASNGTDCWEQIAKLADAGIIAGPGAFYGYAGQQHIRLAITATDSDIELAAKRLAAL